MRSLGAGILVLALALIGGCQDAHDVDPAPQAPDPIGPELMSHIAGIGPCGIGHLYREAREIQALCFDQDGNFTYENRGTLTAEAAQKLDDELAAADLSATDPVNFMGHCGALDGFGTQTVWVGNQSVTFDNGCPIEGIVGLYGHVLALWTELGECGQESFELLEAIEPGCRTD